MGTKVVVKFRIKPRRAKAPATGKSTSSTENLLITMRVTYGALRIESKSIIVFYLQFLTDVEIIVEAIIILIDDAHAAIGGRNFQHLQ